MKKLFNKFNLLIISLVFALALCFGGIALFAPKQVDAAQYVAQAGSTQYATLKEAFDSAKDGEQTNVKLLANVTITEIIEISATKNVVFDLNSFSLVNQDDGVFRVLGTLCIKGNGYVRGAAEGETISIISVGQTGTFVLDGGTIAQFDGTGNSCIYSKGTVTINGGSIENGSAENGGGIDNQGALTINGGTISNNRATRGGGIYSQGTLTINGGTISNNTADDGGGIYSTGGTLTISDGTISNNTANNGGGIYAVDYCKVDITNGAIKQNNAVNDGGGIFFTKGRLKMTGGTILSNTAGMSGGGIFNVSDNSNTNAVEIAGGFIESNTAGGNGGGIFNSIDTSKGKLSISDSAMITKNQSKNGAGIYNDGGDFSAVGGSVLQNVAKNGGGGIFNNYGTLDVTKITISNNSADAGGGIYTVGGTANVKYNTLISQNTARLGGGVYINSNNVLVKKATITQNTATENGGGIYNEGTVVIEGGEITNNKARNGAGIYNSGTVTINGTVSDVTISGNEAIIDGGGIYNDSSLYVNGSFIQNNKATSGAGMYNNDGEVQFSNAEIKDNVAQSSGGGVHNRGTASFTSCKITGNKATIGCGIYNRAAATGDTLSISMCEVSGNGAIQSNAVPRGSGIFNDSKTVVTINASEITNNGGDTSQNLDNRGNISAQETKIDGIFVNGSATNTTAQFDVTGNTNEIKHLQNYATVSISNCTISGEFVNNSGTANFNTCTFSQTTNSAITIKDGNARVENSTVSGRIDVDDGYFNLTASHINLLNNSGTAIVVARSCTTVVNYGTLTYSGANPKTLMVASSSAQTTMDAFAEVVFFAQIATVDMNSQTLTQSFTVITGHGLALKDRQLFANYRGAVKPLYHGNTNDYQLHTEFFLQADGQGNVFSRLIDAKAISVQQKPTVTQYKYGQQLDKTGLVVLASYTNDTTDYIDAGDVQVIYQNGNFFNVGDTQVTLRYVNKQGQNVDCVLDELVVTKALVAKPATDKQTVTFNGQKQVANVSATADVTITNNGGTNAGNYTVTFALANPDNYMWDDGTSDNLTMAFEIAKATVSKPNLDKQSVVYNGQNQVATVEQNSLYSATNNGGTNVGVYTVTYSLSDKANYIWADGSADDLIFDFEITKTTATIGDVSVLGNVRGEDLQINATSNFGDVQYSYAKKGESNFSSEKPTKPGEYIAKMTVAGTNNFDGAEKTVEFVIESKLFAGEIVGIVAGSVAVAGGIGVGIWFLIKKRKRI